VIIPKVDVSSLRKFQSIRKNYSDREQEDCCSKPACANTWQDSLEKTHHKKELMEWIKM
jgi:hypothetical protein